MRAEERGTGLLSARATPVAADVAARLLALRFLTPSSRGVPVRNPN